jgi:glutathione S-transferase
MFLAEKGLEVELREARGNPAHNEAARALSAGGTLPVFVDDEGFVIADSTAIAGYLEAIAPEPRLYPRGEATRVVFAAMAQCDTALTHIIDLATRYHPLSDSAGFEAIKTEMLGRAQRSLDALGALVGDRETLDPAGFGIGDIWATTTVSWLDKLPARRGENANIDRLLTLRWEVPASLSRYAAVHRGRASFPV